MKVGENVNKKVNKISIKDLEQNLINDYVKWKDIYENGCQDPNWEDGTNLNLKRTHIEVGKKNIKEILGDNFIKYPDIFFFPLPPKLPNSFMSVDRELARKNGILANTKELEYNEIMQFDFSEIFE